MKFLAQVLVLLKPDLLDPQGKAVEKAIQGLGLKSASGTRVGKVIRFFLDGESKEKASKDVERISKTLLANPVVEDTEIEIRELGEQ